MFRIPIFYHDLQNSIRRAGFGTLLFLLFKNGIYIYHLLISCSINWHVNYVNANFGKYVLLVLIFGQINMDAIF